MNPLFGDYYMESDFKDIEFLKEKLFFWKKLFIDALFSNDIDKAKTYKGVHERIEIDLKIEEKEYHDQYSNKPTISLFA